MLEQLAFGIPLGSVIFPSPIILRSFISKGQQGHAVIHNLKLNTELTVPFCILLVCSQDASPAQPPHRRAAHPMWATSLDTGICTWEVAGEEILGREVQSKEQENQGKGEGSWEGRQPKLPTPLGGKAALVLFKTAPSLSSNGMKLGERDEQRKEFQSSFTSAGKPRIFCGRRSRLCAPGGSPSAPGISPGVGSGLHQIGLGRAWKGTNTVSAQLPLALEKGNVQLWLYLTGLTSNESSQHKSHTILCFLPSPLLSLFNYLYLVPKWSFSFGMFYA